MEIRLYCGLMRQGKTLNMAKDVIFKNLIYGRRVITNTPIWYDMPDGRRIEAELYEDYERYKFEFMRAKGALVVTDEMSIFYKATGWANLEDDFNHKFRQAAKEGCDLYGTTQSFVDTVANLRRIVSTYFLCKKSYFLIPFPLDFRRDIYNKEKGFFDHKGFYWHMPVVYDAIRVDPAYFKSNAMLPENKERFIRGHRRIYPSEFRRISPFYNHEYLIKSSATKKGGGGKLTDWQVFTSWESYRDELIGKKKKKEALEVNTVTTVDII
jgi:hypothetical protein